MIESARTQRQRQLTGVVKLKHDAAGPAWIDTVRGNVHHQPQARQRGASVQPAYQVGRQGDRLVGHRQRQFARMQEKSRRPGPLPA